MPELDSFESFFRWIPPAWQRDALCIEHPEVEFFVERGEPSGPAKAICARCLVQRECRDFAIANGEQHGIWGGLSVRERLRVRRESNAAA